MTEICIMAQQRVKGKILGPIFVSVGLAYHIISLLRMHVIQQTVHCIHLKVIGSSRISLCGYFIHA